MADAGDPDLSTMSGELDYRSVVDDAWYSVRLVLQNERLIVKYKEFHDVYDEPFWAGDDKFSTPEKIAAFRNRFRPLSGQLQDSQCSLVKKGTLVCASSGCGDAHLFYDAVVDEVMSEQHSFEQECRCTFLVSWIHGPNVGTLSIAKIENMCLVNSSNQMDPRLTSFLRILEEKLGISLPGSGSVVAGGKYKRESHNSTFECKADYGFQLREGPVPLSGTEGKDRGKALKFVSDSAQDLEMGGTNYLKRGAKKSKGPYIILIENLDKCISSSTIVNFIYGHTSITSDANVFPCPSSESYTRGALVVDSAEKLQKLHNFLHKPDQIITSSRGRPWVVLDMSKNDSCIASYGCLELNSQSKKQYIKTEPGEGDDTLKVVRSGSEEYGKAEKLRDLFLEFSNHQQRLHRRLDFEEKLILQPPPNLACGERINLASCLMI